MGPGKCPWECPACTRTWALISFILVPSSAGKERVAGPEGAHALRTLPHASWTHFIPRIHLGNRWDGAVSPSGEVAVFSLKSVCCLDQTPAKKRRRKWVSGEGDSSLSDGKLRQSCS